LYSCKITYIIIYRWEHTMEAAGGRRSGPVVRNPVQQSQRHRATATAAADNATTVHSAGGPSLRTPGRCPLTPCPHEDHNNKNNNLVVINSVQL